MSHLCTIFRVKAETEEDAIDDVNNFLEGCPYDGHPFDYFDESETVISEDIKTEEDFQALRQEEIDSYKSYLEQALKLPDDNIWKSSNLKWAGQALDASDWDSIERLAYEYAYEQQEEDAPGKIWFVDTDRHW